MQTLTIGDVTITSIVERDGPWRRPQDFFLGYEPARSPPRIWPPWIRGCSTTHPARS